MLEEAQQGFHTLDNSFAFCPVLFIFPIPPPALLLLLQAKLHSLDRSFFCSSVFRLAASLTMRVLVLFLNPEVGVEEERLRQMCG